VLGAPPRLATVCVGKIWGPWKGAGFLGVGWGRLRDFQASGGQGAGKGGLLAAAGAVWGVRVHRSESSACNIPHPVLFECRCDTETQCRVATLVGA
jgi:hypothetical protein